MCTDISYLLISLHLPTPLLPVCLPCDPHSAETEGGCFHSEWGVIKKN